MSELPLGMTPGRGCAARRLAAALLQSYGASQVTIRVADPSTGDTSSQLGLEAPPAEDLQISPCAVSSLPSAADGSLRFEFMLSATTLAPIAKAHQVDDIATWLLTAEGVLHHDQLMHIDSVTVDRFCGSDCFYRITTTE
ncbi:MAG: hypothetical protein WCC87_20615 [Candidatus Korobacteraceae bacterium]